MYYSVKELARYFGKNEQWIYNRMSEIKMKPTHTVESFNNQLNPSNYYTASQKDMLEAHIRLFYTKNKTVIVQEISYYIYESKMNYLDIKHL